MDRGDTVPSVAYCQQLIDIDRDHNLKHGDMLCLKAIPNSKYKLSLLSRLHNMRQRCTNLNNNNYCHYGERGIKVEYKYNVDFCHDWIDEFKKSVDKNGFKNSSFDRIDVNGNYCKSNLRITNQTVQNINCTDRKFFIVYKGKDRVLSDSFMEVGKHYHINGRAIGNLVRGGSKSSFGWKFDKLVEITKENLKKTIENEGITTNLIVSL